VRLTGRFLLAFRLLALGDTFHVGARVLVALVGAGRAVVDSSEGPDAGRRGDARSRLRRKNWARLLQKVYELTFCSPQSCSA